MKRTREVIHYQHPADRPNISGCTFFDGEDHSEENRRKKAQQENREYLMRQMEEKKMKKELQRTADM
jgi:hypothetical protein